MSIKQDFPLYRYMATVVKVIDGDSIVLNIDEGFRHFWRVSCRLSHIDAPELRSQDEELKIKAKEATEYLKNRLPIGSMVYIISKNLDKYGRPEAEMFYEGVSINQEMIDKGLAVAYKR